ncbi:MAG: CRISPR-associated endonuclease Cas2 [Thermoflexus sp.]|uniref:CRISPR-associated endonuclease Cas2 n=1 Tax=Thermoflexus sp. TaxID=1969742 RepID=UPI0025E2E21C|nr:CRISPR-associated endonuclease Cas2 [Thermoflexus sp.]MCS6964474.1 CRISPR-associated endonuclease Cas2 [Thermoflexus sp.]MDW8185770.1 CRISPR-associated endonuclease Cas2 [Anaerolineae bacterium]
MPYLVIAYDVPDNLRRLRLARILLGALDRVQKSVFEGEVEEGRIARIEERIRRVVRPEDSVRIYILCAACQRRIRGIGQGASVREPVDFWVV